MLEGGLRSLEICKRHGVPVAYGSDLLGELHWDQSREFTLRREVVKPIEIIRSATTIPAQILRLEGKVGTLAAGRLRRSAYWSTAIPSTTSALLGGSGPAPVDHHAGRPFPQTPASIRPAAPMPADLQRRRAVKVAR